jgi:hypothetical protein
VRGRFAAVAALITCLAVPSGARAGAGEDAQASAARAFVAGEGAVDAGDSRHAAAEFEAAYTAKPHHAPLWNAARSWERAGEDVRAANLLERYLHEAPPDAPDRDLATATVAALSKRLGRIQAHLVGVTDARIDGVALDGASVLWVAPGEHVASAESARGPVRKLVAVERGQLVSLTLGSPEEASPFASPPAPREEVRRPLSPWVVVSGGVLVVVGAGLTTAFGLETVSKKESFLGDPTQARLDDAHASQTRTNVALGATIGLAVVTGVIAALLVEWRHAPRPAPPSSGLVPPRAEGFAW